MVLKRTQTKDNKWIKKGMKLTIGLSIAFFMAVTSNSTSYADFQRPNTKAEIEPNNTQETAQVTYPTNEDPKKFSTDDWSGRYCVSGSATSSDDDWYKVDLLPGTQYLSVVHYYGDNATYVELLDSENNVIIDKKHGTRYNVTPFNSTGGTYYIHIVGASEAENKYAVYVGTPTLSSNELTIRFDPQKTSGTIKKSFSLKYEDILPDEALVSSISLTNFIPNFSGARASCSTSSKSVTFNKNSFKNGLGPLDLRLKSDWNIEFYPKSTVTAVPTVTFRYFYPVYDNTVYPDMPTIKK